MSIDGDCPFCHKVEENIDHIFKECELATNVWYAIKLFESHKY